MEAFPASSRCPVKAQEDVIMDELDDSEINEDELMSLLGHYWHLIIAADTILRSGLRDGETEAAVKSILEENKIVHTMILKVAIVERFLISFTG